MMPVTKVGCIPARTSSAQIKPKVYAIWNEALRGRFGDRGQLDLVCRITLAGKSWCVPVRVEL